MKHINKTMMKKVLAAVSSVALGLGIGGAAHAGALSYSHLLIDNFIATNSGGTQYDLSDFDNIQINNTSSTTASINGVGLPLNTTLDTTSGSGNANDNLSCTGGPCAGIVDDTFAQQPAPISDTFARGDTLLLGAIITGVPGATQDFVTAHSLSEGQTSITGFGEGNSSVGTSTELSFSLANDDTITFEFDATPFIDVLLHQDQASVFGSLNFSISIFDNTDNVDVYAFAPIGINTSRSLNSTGQITYNPGTLMFSDTTPLLLADHTYTLTIDHRTRTTFEAEKEVPEPSILILLGAGLLGMGVIRRRGGRALSV